MPEKVCLFPNQDFQFSIRIVLSTAGESPVPGFSGGIAYPHITGSARDKFIEADDGLFFPVIVNLHGTVSG